MKLQRRRFLYLAACAAALPVVPRIAGAQTYPSRPVRLIVSVPPGAGADFTARHGLGVPQSYAVQNWDIHSRRKCLRSHQRSAKICHRGGLRQEAHREIRNTDVCGSGAIVVAGFGRRTAICLRGTGRSLYRKCPGLCGTGSRRRRAALCGTGCIIRRTGLWGAGLRGTGTRLRSAGSYRTGARIRNAGLRGTWARLRGSCLLWGRSARRTASLCRARARLPRLCGRIRAEATRRHPLQRRRSVHRQSRPRPVGILQLRQRRQVSHH
jgi:hypothetical protein